MDKVTNSKRLMQRFTKDYNLPINVFNEEMFEYYKNLYDFFPKDTWDNLCKTIEEKYDGNVELWLDYCAGVRDAAILGVMNTDEYKTFNASDMSVWDINPEVPKVGEHGVYNEENRGCNFLSIDLRKANFQALKYAGVIKDETYDDFIKRFGGDDYIIGSKYLRQVIFGKMNPSRTIKVEKYIMGKIYMLIHEYIESLGYRFYSLNSDELIFKQEDVDHPNVFQSDVDYVVDIVKEEIGVDVRVESFVLGRFDIYNVNGNKVDAYSKLNALTGEETLKKASTTFSPQIYKIWKNLPIEKRDLIFFFEDQLATFNEPLKYEYYEYNSK